MVFFFLAMFFFPFRVIDIEAHVLHIAGWQSIAPNTSYFSLHAWAMRLVGHRLERSNFSKKVMYNPAIAMRLLNESRYHSVPKYNDIYY